MPLKVFFWGGDSEFSWGRLRIESLFISIEAKSLFLGRNMGGRIAICTVLHLSILYYTVLYCTVVHLPVGERHLQTVLYCSILFRDDHLVVHLPVGERHLQPVLYCTVLYCTVLFRDKHLVVHLPVGEWHLQPVLYFTVLYCSGQTTCCTLTCF